MPGPSTFFNPERGNKIGFSSLYQVPANYFYCKQKLVVSKSYCVGIIIEK